jgi:hypothetical protein
MVTIGNHSDANHFVLNGEKRWIAVVQFNGELLAAEQEELIERMRAACAPPEPRRREMIEYHLACKPKPGLAYIVLAHSMHGWPRPAVFVERVGLWPADGDWFSGFMAACLGNVCIMFLTDSFAEVQ